MSFLIFFSLPSFCWGVVLVSPSLDTCDVQQLLPMVIFGRYFGGGAVHTAGAPVVSNKDRPGESSFSVHLVGDW